MTGLTMGAVCILFAKKTIRRARFFLQGLCFAPNYTSNSVPLQIIQEHHEDNIFVLLFCQTVQEAYLPVWLLLGDVSGRSDESGSEGC